MAFSSSVVSLEWRQNNLILSRGQSQLLIKAEDVQSLRACSEKESFEDYFRTKALVNREARRVFLSWERKDESLLAKLHEEVRS